MISRPIALLTAAIAVVGANSMVLAPIAASVARDIGGAPTEIVQAAAAYGLTTAISAIFLAPRGDVIGPHAALRQAMVILMVSLVWTALVQSKGMLILTQAIGGIGAGMAIPAIYSLAPQLAPPGAEKRTMGLVLSGWTLALVAGVAGSGFLANWAGWRAVYVTLALCLMMVILASRVIDLTTKSRATRPTSPLTALAVPGIWRGLFAAGALMLGFYGTYAFLGAHVDEALGRGTDGAGFVTLAYGVGFGLSTFLDRLMDRLHPRHAGAIAFAGLTLTYLLMSQANMMFEALITLALFWGVVQHMGLNFVVSRLAALDPEQRGAVLGLNSAVTYLAVTGGALAFRPFYEMGGLVLCNLLSAAMVGLAVVESLTARIKTDPTDG